MLNGSRPLNRLGFSLAIVLLVSTSSGLASKRPQPPPLDEVAQTWIGISGNQRYLIRLELHADGTGLGAYTYRADEPRLFDIPTWHFKEGRIRIEPVAPLGPPTWVREMKGSVGGTTMDLKVSAKDWKIQFFLRREAELEERWTMLKRGMAGMAETNG